MDFHYSKEKNVQIIISLLKQYGIRKVIASPGSTNISMVASMQQDPFFEMYSSVDERSAAYMACGMAAESGEPGSINMHIGNSLQKLCTRINRSLLS